MNEILQSSSASSFCILETSSVFIRLSNRNQTIFTAGLASSFVIVLGNTQRIPCGRCLAWHNSILQIFVFLSDNRITCQFVSQCNITVCPMQQPFRKGDDKVFGPKGMQIVKISQKCGPLAPTALQRDFQLRKICRRKTLLQSAAEMMERAAKKGLSQNVSRFVILRNEVTKDLFFIRFL